MEQEYREILYNVFCKVMEEFAFMFTEMVEKEDIVTSESDYVQSTMAFKGEVDGVISIAVPESMCSEIAANVVGLSIDDERIVALRKDALNEVLNVLCGNLLTNLVGEKPIFSLSIPEISKITKEGWEVLLNNSNTMSFTVDDYPVLIELSIEEEF